MIEKLCKDLQTTYDTNILDNEHYVVQQEFLNVSFENKENNGRKVLMKLICNHYDEMVRANKPIAEFIGGPKTLSIHWHPVYKKIIYIFGEWHANITDCKTFKKDAVTVPAEDYLYDLILSTDVFLDIYIELESYKEGDYLYEPYVDGRTNELFKKFRRCLQYNTRYDASCQLARVHYFNIRNNNIGIDDDIEENKINILWIRQKIQDILNEENNKENCVSSLKLLLKKYPKITTLLKQLVQDDIKKVCEFMKKQLAENIYIKKELDKIEDKELKIAILTFYGDLISKEIISIMPYIKEPVIKILNYKKELTYLLFKSMTDIELFFGGTNSYFADVYLLGRMFKDFDMSEIEKKAYKGATDQPIRANNIIIYCGDNHAKNYRNFLENIGFNEIDHAGDLSEDIIKPVPNTPKNCLDMRRIKQPFFSYSSEEKEESQFNRLKIPTPDGSKCRCASAAMQMDSDFADSDIGQVEVKCDCRLDASWFAPLELPTSANFEWQSIDTPERIPSREMIPSRIPSHERIPSREMIPSRIPSHERIPSPEKHPVIIIQKRCCDRPTQFPLRMALCEGHGHTFASVSSYFGSFVLNQDSNLDGIVELRNDTILENEPTFKEVEYLDTKPYISDHNGIVLHLSVDTINFNIISCNLEGLCRQTKNDSKYRIKNIKDHFTDVIKKGSIIVFQEIVLQKLANSTLDVTDEEDDEDSVVVKTHKWVNVVGKEILLELESINDNLIFMSDTYTGGIFYDSSVWELNKTIDINRLYNGSLSAKFSNAYLFNCISTKCLFWVVNIHLKAFPPGSTEHTLDLVLYSHENVNNAHIIELEHIISQLLLESRYFQIPIYLCGDYNNHLQKDILVAKAIEKCMKSLHDTEYKIDIRTMPT